MKEPILFVDDDENLLQGLKRNLHKEKNFEISILSDPKLAVELIKKKFFSVIVADYQMPGLNGIDFLAQVKEILPISVRVMLTGNADINMAIDAVNEGHIFRFLTKPCRTPELVKTLNACLQQYNLRKAEKELLESTLKGSVKVLVDILNIVNPSAFSRTERIRRTVGMIVSMLNPPEIWLYDLAAMLSQLGWLALPPDILEKDLNGKLLTEIEKQTVNSHPEIAFELIKNIPRLEDIAKMVKLQHNPRPIYPQQELNEITVTALGSNLLFAALEIDKMLYNGLQKREIIDKLTENGKTPEIITSILEFLDIESIDRIEKSVYMKDLRVNMIINDDIYAVNGSLLAVKGMEITNTMLVRLRSFSRSLGIIEPIRVLI